MDEPIPPAAPRTYPRPDRSDYTPAVTRAPDGDTLDIGWAEGVLSDGRPFRAEAWAEGGVTSLTVFFSVVGLESLTNDACGALLERERLVRFLTSPRLVAVRPFADASGQPLWSANVVVGSEHQLYASTDAPLHPYAPAGGTDAG